VVLFPLEKELSELEYDYLKPNVNKVLSSKTIITVQALNLCSRPFTHLKNKSKMFTQIKTKENKEVVAD
jgi:DNA sulfur modification protein DndD